MPECLGEAVFPPKTATPLTLEANLGPARGAISSLVNVSFTMPFRVDGESRTSCNGIGVVFDAKRGIVVVDRNTVPTLIGDVSLTFCNSIIINANVLLVHETLNFSVIVYDPAQLGETPVSSALISETRLTQGDSVYLVCLTKSYRPVVRKTIVSSIRQFHIQEIVPPAYRASNVEGIELENPVSHGGVLTDEKGGVQALYIEFTQFNSKGNATAFFMGMSVSHVLPLIRSLISTGQVPRPYYLPLEMAYTQVAHARMLGLTEDWVKKIGKKKSGSGDETSVSDGSFFL